MEPVLTSGAPGPLRRLQRWARRYPAPLGLGAAFLALLAASALGGPWARPRAGPPQRDRSRPTLTVRSPCPVCGLGERCDPQSGRCVLEETPPPCVAGAHFDPQAGYCVPDPTPRPKPPPSQTLRPGPAGKPPSLVAPSPEPTPLPTGAPRSPFPTFTPHPSPTPPASSPPA